MYGFTLIPSVAHYLTAEKEAVCGAPVMRYGDGTEGMPTCKSCMKRLREQLRKRHGGG